jgi:hypothetical protein
MGGFKEISRKSRLSNEVEVKRHIRRLNDYLHGRIILHYTELKQALEQEGITGYSLDKAMAHAYYLISNSYEGNVYEHFLRTIIPETTRPERP